VQPRQEPTKQLYWPRLLHEDVDPHTLHPVLEFWKSSCERSKEAGEGCGFLGRSLPACSFSHMAVLVSFGFSPFFAFSLVNFSDAYPRVFGLLDDFSFPRYFFSEPVLVIAAGSRPLGRVSLLTFFSPRPSDLSKFALSSPLRVALEPTGGAAVDSFHRPPRVPFFSSPSGFSPQTLFPSHVFCFFLSLALFLWRPFGCRADRKLGTDSGFRLFIPVVPRFVPF